MRLLVVKLSSMGDVVHLLPALTDLHQHRPDISIDWLVEPAFAELAGWHPAVRAVIPVTLRDLKRRFWVAPRVLLDLRRQLRANAYDQVIDAQGLIKSALLARLAGVPVEGLDAGSAREPLASRCYHRTFPVAWGQHAIQRNRQLFAQAFAYPLDAQAPDYGLRIFRQTLLDEPLSAEVAACVQASFVLGLHGTTWDSKHWPEPYWLDLAQKLSTQGLSLVLPWGSAAEQARALRMQAAAPGAVRVLPRLNLRQMAQVMARARAFVGVDTGLSHLAAALALPGLSLYGPTDPQRTGVLGDRHQTVASPMVCAPCLQRRCPLPLTAQGLIPCQALLSVAQVVALLETVMREK